MKTEKVVVFDVDGTLFDTKQGIIKALNEVLDSFEINEIKKEDEDNWIGPPVRDSFIKYAKMTDEQAEEATKLYRRFYVEKYISDSILYEGMSEVLEKMKQNKIHICIATMKTAAQMEHLLSVKNMTEIFEVIQTAALDGSKTKADMLREIKNIYGRKSKYYMIGDTIGDYNAAKIEKYIFIAALYGYGNFQKKQIKKIINNPTNLLLLML